MEEKKYCELLMKSRNNGIQLSSYMGFRWFFLKVVIIIFALSFLLMKNYVIRIYGAVMLGYLLGVVVADVRRYIVLKIRWEIQKEFIDWNKVEEYMKSN
jgi:hypothetical protein